MCSKGADKRETIYDCTILMKKIERRRFPRVMTPVFYRVPRILTAKHPVLNLSLVGVRIYSDERLDVGERLDLEFFLPEGTTVEAMGRVVWIKEMSPGEEALYDVGLEFVELSEDTLEKLKTVLKN
jgi:hypothetical protein